MATYGVIIDSDVKGLVGQKVGPYTALRNDKFKKGSFVKIKTPSGIITKYYLPDRKIIKIEQIKGYSEKEADKIRAKYKTEKNKSNKGYFPKAQKLNKDKPPSGAFGTRGNELSRGQQAAEYYKAQPEREVEASNLAREETTQALKTAITENKGIQIVDKTARLMVPGYEQMTRPLEWLSQAFEADQAIPALLTGGDISANFDWETLTWDIDADAPTDRPNEFRGGFAGALLTEMALSPSTLITGGSGKIRALSKAGLPEAFINMLVKNESIDATYAILKKSKNIPEFYNALKGSGTWSVYLEKEASRLTKKDIMRLTKLQKKLNVRSITTENLKQIWKEDPLRLLAMERVGKHDVAGARKILGETKLVKKKIAFDVAKSELSKRLKNVSGNEMSSAVYEVRGTRSLKGVTTEELELITSKLDDTIAKKRAGLRDSKTALTGLEKTLGKTESKLSKTESVLEKTASEKASVEALNKQRNMLNDRLIKLGIREDKIKHVLPEGKTQISQLKEKDISSINDMLDNGIVKTKKGFTITYKPDGKMDVVHVTDFIRSILPKSVASELFNASEETNKGLWLTAAKIRGANTAEDAVEILLENMGNDFVQKSWDAKNLSKSDYDFLNELANNYIEINPLGNDEIAQLLGDAGGSSRIKLPPETWREMMAENPMVVRGWNALKGSKSIAPDEQLKRLNTFTDYISIPRAEWKDLQKLYNRANELGVSSQMLDDTIQGLYGVTSKRELTPVQVQYIRDSLNAEPINQATGKIDFNRASQNLKTGQIVGKDVYPIISDISPNRLVFKYAGLKPEYEMFKAAQSNSMVNNLEQFKTLAQWKDEVKDIPDNAEILFDLLEAGGDTVPLRMSEFGNILVGLGRDENGKYILKPVVDPRYGKLDIGLPDVITEEMLGEKLYNNTVNKILDNKLANQKIFQDYNVTPGYQTQLLDMATRLRTMFRDYSRQLGIKDDRLIEDYAPHIFDWVVNGKKKPDLPPEILAVLDKIPSNSMPMPFMKRRLGAKGYEKDVWKAATIYSNAAENKIAYDPVIKQLRANIKSGMYQNNTRKYLEHYMDNALGKRSSKLEDFGNKLFADVGKGIEAKSTSLNTALNKQLDKFNIRPVDVSFNPFSDRTFTNATQKVLGWKYTGELGFNVKTYLLQHLQKALTVAEIGPTYTAKGWALSKTDAGKMAFDESGVLLESYTNEMMRGLTGENKNWFETAAWWLFDKAEIGNRSTTYLGARQQFLDAAKRTGMDIDDPTVLANAEKYGKEIVARTQFNYGRLDTPLALQSFGGRLAGQFMTYPANFYAFLYEMGYDTVSDVKSVMKGQAPSSNILLDSLDNTAQKLGEEGGFNYLGKNHLFRKAFIGENAAAKNGDAPLNIYEKGRGTAKAFAKPLRWTAAGAGLEFVAEEGFGVDLSGALGMPFSYKSDEEKPVLKVKNMNDLLAVASGFDRKLSLAQGGVVPIQKNKAGEVTVGLTPIPQAAVDIAGIILNRHDDEIVYDRTQSLKNNATGLIPGGRVASNLNKAFGLPASGYYHPNMSINDLVTSPIESAQPRVGSVPKGFLSTKDKLITAIGLPTTKRAMARETKLSGPNFAPTRLEQLKKDYESAIIRSDSKEYNRLWDRYGNKNGWPKPKAYTVDEKNKIAKKRSEEYSAGIMKAGFDEIMNANKKATEVQTELIPYQNKFYEMYGQISYGDNNLPINNSSIRANLEKAYEISKNSIKNKSPNIDIIDGNRQELIDFYYNMSPNYVTDKLIEKLDTKYFGPPEPKSKEAPK